MTPTIVIGEVLGHFAPDEHQHRLYQRAKAIAPNAVFIPGRYRIVLGAVHPVAMDKELHELRELVGIKLDYLTRKPEGGTFYPMAAPAESFIDTLGKPTGRLRVALSTGTWGREGKCDPEVADKVRTLAHLLEDMKHDVTEIDDGKLCDWEAMWRGYLTQWVCMRVMYTPIAELAGIPPEQMSSKLSPMVYRHFEAAQRYSTLDLYQAMAANNTVTRSLGRFMSGWDVLLCPTHAIRVPSANGPYSLLRDEPLDGWVARLADACRYTMPGNEAGLPGISIPVGLDSDGLPIGAMLYASAGREDLLLRLAAAIEAAKPEWFAQVPPVHVAD